jgi:Protein of unknown function (DUF2806)
MLALQHTPELCKISYSHWRFDTMPGDLVPAEGGGGFLDQFNLPKILAGPAGEAIARLIGGTVDIPAAWLNGVVQGIKDKTEAKTVVSKAVADAAANLARNDPEIVQRAAHALLTKELRHQANRESIARKTIEHLEDTPQEQTTAPDEDWLNVFARYAEDASSERLQNLWARILSGQLKHPKIFSLSTLRFAAELDEDTAALFEKWSPQIVSADFIPFIPNEGEGFTELIKLDDAGLVSGVIGQVSKMYRDPALPEQIKALPLHFSFKDYEVVAVVEWRFNFNLRAALLTKVGREIFSITKAPGSMDVIRSFVEQFPKDRVQSIVCIPSADRSKAEQLWVKPPEQAPGR